MDELNNKELMNAVKEVEVEPEVTTDNEVETKPARKKPGPKPKVKVDESFDKSFDEEKDIKETVDSKETVGSNESPSSLESENDSLKSIESEPRNNTKDSVLRLEKPVRCYSKPNESSPNIIIKCTIRLTGYQVNGYEQVLRMKPGFGKVVGYIKEGIITNLLNN